MLGVDDKLMQESFRSIPRADVAELCVQCLGASEAQNRYAILHLLCLTRRRSIFKILATVSSERIFYHEKTACCELDFQFRAVKITVLQGSTQ